MWSDYCGPKRMCMTWSTLHSRYFTIWPRFGTGYLRFGPIYSDLVIRVTRSAVFCSIQADRIMLTKHDIVRDNRRKIRSAFTCLFFLNNIRASCTMYSRSFGVSNGSIATHVRPSRKAVLYKFNTLWRNEDVIIGRRCHNKNSKQHSHNSKQNYCNFTFFFDLELHHRKRTPSWA